MHGRILSHLALLSIFSIMLKWIPRSNSVAALRINKHCKKCRWVRERGIVESLFISINGKSSLELAVKRKSRRMAKESWPFCCFSESEYEKDAKRSRQAFYIMWFGFQNQTLVFSMSFYSVFHCFIRHYAHSL